ncbi:hypothetical protein PRZ61_10585 [Halomonas pacifica]|uniref:hypothetical protein n=1 Tax=Bisbaumannia pacifica TaxID=77098 RepID=UPI002358A703|nr:hypothetical protein [Halomonas pacifica]MDC8803881.1 hypothetical protein [Halomonas pacifica]
MSKTRQPGWYWVKVEDLPPNDAAEWEAAQWDGRHWHVTGADHEWSEASIDVVGPRIPTPDEPWQTVPVKPTPEMKASCRVAGKLRVWDDMLAAAPKPGGGDE